MVCPTEWREVKGRVGEVSLKTTFRVGGLAALRSQSHLQLTQMCSAPHLVTPDWDHAKTEQEEPGREVELDKK